MMDALARNKRRLYTRVELCIKILVCVPSELEPRAVNGGGPHSHWQHLQVVSANYIDRIGSFHMCVYDVLNTVPMALRPPRHPTGMNQENSHKSKGIQVVGAAAQPGCVCQQKVPCNGIASHTCMYQRV